MMAGKKERVGAVIVAAGKSERMGDVDKMFASLGGQPLLLRTTQPFQQCPEIDQIVVVVSGEKEMQCRHLVSGPEWSKVSDVCLGGKRRQDSVAEGLQRLADCDWAVIHDGARPLVTVELIERGLEAARETGAAVAAVPVTDTIKVADQGRTVLETPPRQIYGSYRPRKYSPSISSARPIKTLLKTSPTARRWWSGWGIR